MSTKKGNWLNLEVGDEITIGAASSELCGYEAGTVLHLIEGFFDYENGLYTETETAPSVLDEDQKDFSSIYHIFGNDLEHFKDSVVTKSVKQTQEIL